MISFVKKKFTREESLAVLDEHVRKWFMSKFQDLTPPQYYSFKLIAAGENVLITAPTGSGKTYSAFLVIISELLKLAKENKLEDRVYCIYVSPLRALTNDIHRNLMEPLRSIEKLLEEEKIKIDKKIRVAVRTGDVPPSKKQTQLKYPPHILITTPESLAIILNSPKFVELIKDTKYVIVDEIHELASNKRGVHLSLSLERLVDLVGHDFVRIGLGATLHPLREAANFLIGKPDRKCKIVDANWTRKIDIEVLCPVSDIINASEEKIEKNLYEILRKLIDEHRTTLIFTNTRSGTERVVFNLRKKFRYGEKIAAHHGSLSRELRLDVEEKLKRGELKAVVSSTSLELGIDIGYIDLVVQLGSPKSVTRAVQRIGRSGHAFGAIPKGKIIAIDRDDLVECAVIAECAKHRELDRFLIPTNCLDVLAQHIVGMALTKKWKVEEALELIRRSYCYKNLDKETFVSLLNYLAGKYVDLEYQHVYGKIWFDEHDGVFGRRGKGTRMIYFLNIGTIPDEVKVDVFTTGSKKWIGSIEEDFLMRLKKGDIFVLGGKTYCFDYARAMSAYVTLAEHATPTIPPWFSELLPLSYELAIKIGKLRKELEIALRERNSEKVDKLLKKIPASEEVKKTIANYFMEQFLYAKIPNHQKIIIEKTKFQEKDYIVFHSLFGRRANDALARVFAFLVSEEIGSDVGLTISDNGFALILPPNTIFSLNKIIKQACNSNLRKLLRENIRRTELMKRKFRHTAARSFLVLRNYKGHKISVKRQQINAQTLLSACEEISEDFPVIEETYREILEDLFDIETAEKILKKIKREKIKIEEIYTQIPSPFAHNLILLGEADVVLMKDRRKKLADLHRKIMERIRRIEESSIVSKMVQ